MPSTLHGWVFVIVCGMFPVAAYSQTNVDFEGEAPDQPYASQDSHWITNSPSAVATVRRQDAPLNQYLEIESAEGGIRTAKIFGPLRGKIKTSFDFKLETGGFYVRWFESPQSSETMQRSIGFDVLSDGRVRLSSDGVVRWLGSIKTGNWIRATIVVELGNDHNVTWELAMKNLTTGDDIPLQNAVALPASFDAQSPTEIGGIVFAAQRGKGMKLLVDNWILSSDQEYPAAIPNPGRK